MNFEVEYLVNEENGIVICVLSECACNAVDAIAKRIPEIVGLSVFDPSDKYYINDTFKGVARCSAEDTFDEELGKKIAFRKAYLKLANSTARKVRALYKEFEKFSKLTLEDYKAAFEKAMAKAESAQVSYDRLMNEVNNETT